MSERGPNQPTADQHMDYRRVGVVAALCAAAVLVVAWLFIRWDWSPIDDAGHVLALRASLDEHGPVLGPFAYSLDLFNVDRTWALFRPSYWVYPAFFYLLPLPAAHLVRLVMVVVAIAGPVLYFLRRGWTGSSRWMIIAVVLGSASGLYLGLYFTSLQELSGAAFVGLGLALRGAGWRVASWTVAAWFKSPFSWLLIGEGIVLWRRGQKRLAVTAWVIGVGTLVVSALMARSGSYTSAYSLDPITLWSSVPSLITPENVFLVVMVVWWAAWSSTRFHMNESTVVFGIGFVGYAVQMLPWGLSAYYMGPITFLLGLLLLSMLDRPSKMSRARTLLALSLPVLLAFMLVAWPVRQVLQTNTVFRGLADCLVEYPQSATALVGDMPYVTSSTEGPIRLMQNLELRGSGWSGEVVLEDPLFSRFADPSTDLYAVIGPVTFPQGRIATPVCQAGNATLYELGA